MHSMTFPPPRFPSFWRPPPERLMPAEGEVLVFGAHLDAHASRLTALRTTFSSREEERFQSFATDELRSRWGAGRGVLREVLARALGARPAEIEFRYGPHGKPQLSAAPLQFNISHSGSLAVIALAGVPVGVDVELPRARRSDDIARRFYAPAEVQRLFAEPDARRRADAFFRLWTCKEAFLKVTGEGLSRSTRSYEIALDPPRLLWARGVPDAAQRYSVQPLDVGDPYRAALVVAQPQATLRFYVWS
jgi:4'-phosphopantetheinyl transferase